MDAHKNTRSRQRSGAVHSNHDHDHKMVPLSVLLSRELQFERLERPVIRYGLEGRSKKGEDFAMVKTDCQRIPGDGSSTFAVFSVLDGHNGAAAAVYTKENLLNDVMAGVPPNLSRDEWLAMLPRALVAGFVKTDKEFQRKEQSSGTTVTFVVVDGWTITVGSVGDSCCILDSQGGVVSTLTVDHRLEDNAEERDRVTASGGEVGRLCMVGGVEIGPLRCWPGGLCLSRSIGDMDVGEFIVPIPHVKQIKLSSAGGRLIIASDGVWDSMSRDKAAKCCRGLSPELAAKQIVQEALKARGLHDDTTCLVVDLMAPSTSAPEPPVIKKQSKLKSLFFGKRRGESTDKGTSRFAKIAIVEELFEQGSASLAERLGTNVSKSSSSGLFHCAICQTDITPSEGISVHAGSFFSISERPWEGPFLCASCKLKKDAMEGKKASIGMSVA